MGDDAVMPRHRRLLVLEVCVGVVGLAVGLIVGHHPTLGVALLVTVLVVALVPMMRVDWRWVVHNMLAHPLLVLFPPLGGWLHDRTAPADDEDPVAPDQTDWTHRP